MNKSYQIKPVKTHTEIQQCWEVIFLLRPHLNKDTWITMVEEMMQREQFFIDGIFDNNQFVAFAGYRHMTTLHTGNFIYIDDLCTLESHRQGPGFATPGTHKSDCPSKQQGRCCIRYRFHKQRRPEGLPKKWLQSRSTSPFV